MRVVDRTLKFSGPTASVLYTACWHIGNNALCEEGIDTFLKKAQKSPWVHLGDICEAIMPSDPRFSIQEHDNPVLAQQEFAAKKMKTAKKNLWVLIPGNHDIKLSSKIGGVVPHILELMGYNEVQKKEQFLTYSCFMRIHCPKGICETFLSHGGSTASYSSGEAERISINKKVRLRNILRRFSADVRGIAHMHNTIISPPVYMLKLLPVGKQVKRRPVAEKPGWCFACPSMFKTYDDTATHGNYAEAKLYNPTDIGWIEVVLNRDGTVKCIRQILEDGRIKQELEPTVVE